MGLIGRDSKVGASSTVRVNGFFHTMAQTRGVYTAPANEGIFRFGVESGNTGGNGFELGVYDITAGVNNAPLVAAVTILTPDPDTRYTVDLGSDVALTEGNLYSICHRNSGGSAYIYRENFFDGDGAVGDTLNSVPLEPNFDWTSGNTDGWQYVCWAETRVQSTPVVITNITDPITTGQNFTIDGTGFEALQGGGSVTLGGVTCSIVSWSDTQIVATCPTIESTSLNYGTQTIVVTNDSTGTDNTTSTINPVSGESFVNLVAPLATSGDRITAIPDLDGNDQLRYENVLYLGGSPTAYSVAVLADGSFTVSSATTIPDGTYTFNVRAWDDADQTWGTAGDQTVIINTGSSPTTGIDSKTIAGAAIDALGITSVQIT